MNHSEFFDASKIKFRMKEMKRAVVQVAEPFRRRETGVADVLPGEAAMVIR